MNGFTRNMFVSALLAGGVGLAMTARAADVDLEKGQSSRWNGELEFGYVKTTGNTDIENIILKAKAVNERPRWTHELRFSGLRNEDSGTTTAKNATLQGDTQYKWSERSYLFGTGRYEKDDFAGYDYRAVGVAGLGHKVLWEKRYHLELEAGAGGRRTAYIDKPDASEGIGRLAGKFFWQISDTAQFTTELYMEAGDDNTVTDSLSELKVKVIGHLAVKMSVRATHNTDVPPDTDKTDVRTAFTAVYDF